MGVDWFRMRPKTSVDPAELKRLIDVQASAFQAMPGGWMLSIPVSTPDVVWKDAERQHLPQYLESSATLRDLLDFPPCDLVTYVPLDYPDLEPCFRVYPITYNHIFPPWLRMRAYRTILPEELAAQTQIWKTWRAEVIQGLHRRYLLDVYLYETTLTLVDNWEYLQGAAHATLTKTNAWAQKPAFLTVRDEILNLPCPQLCLAPIRVDSLIAES